jgi:hypothetical protein
MNCVRCGQRAVQRHHIVYKQALRDVVLDGKSYTALCADERNLTPVCFSCHGAHHNRSRPLKLQVLPSSVFDFAAEVLGGPGPAYEYLRRRYDGQDSRLDALNDRWVRRVA